MNNLSKSVKDFGKSVKNQSLISSYAGLKILRTFRRFCKTAPFFSSLTANFKFLNRFTYSSGPIKMVSKVCGDSQALKSPGMLPILWL